MSDSRSDYEEDEEDNMPFDFDGWDLDVNATEVNLTGSDITSDDLIVIVERLKEMPNLVSLNLKGNQITSIEGLSGLVGLTYLYLSSNQITSIGSLSGMVDIKEVSLDKSKITNIKASETFTISPFIKLLINDDEKFATFIFNSLIHYEQSKEKNTTMAEKLQTIQNMHASIQRMVIQQDVSSWGYNQFYDTVTFAVRGLVVAYFGKLWLDRKLWVQALSSPSDAYIFDSVVQMYLVLLPTLVLKTYIDSNDEIPYKTKKGFVPGALPVVLLLTFYYRWWYPFLSSFAQCLGTDVETEATQNRLLLLSGMPSRTSNMAYVLAFIRAVVPITVMIHYGISSFAWYHRYMNTVDTEYFGSIRVNAAGMVQGNGGLGDGMFNFDHHKTNREKINATIEKLQKKCLPTKKTILYSKYGFVVLCIAIYSIEHYLNLFDFDTYIINRAFKFKDDKINWIDGYLDVESSKHSFASVACAKIIDDCHPTNGFTCEEMIAAVQPGGCAGDCDDAIKNNMIQRYNDGEFESLCLNITSEEL